MAERKKKHQDAETSRPEYTSVGEMLRAARTARKLEFEDVSVSIHIRPSQLRAIEENDIDALPGMTYAVGFVRSYANFLGLNGAEIVHRFKAEQGHSPSPSKLSFPEPIVESRVPDPMMVGVGAFLAVVILVIWTIYTNVHGSSKTAEQIPPAPDVASVSSTSEPAAMTLAPDVAALSATSLTPAVSTPAPISTPATTVPAASATPDAGKTAVPASASPAASAAGAPVVAKAEPVKAVAAKTDDDETADDAEDSADKSADNDTAAKADEKKDGNTVINIKKGKSRITLKATQASWVQVTDAHQNVLYRKVLRPGEQLAVPDQPGLTLDTANAGGLTLLVDGKTVQPIGQSGEIVRGTILDPKDLKARRGRHG